MFYLFIKIKNTYIYIYSCLLPGITNSNIPITMSTPSALILVFKYHSPKRKLWALGEVVDSRAKAGKTQDKPGTSYGAECKEVLKK